MATANNLVDQAKDLLKTLAPNNDLYKDEYRVALLEAASLAFRFLVVPSDAESPALGASKMCHVQMSSFEKVKNYKGLLPIEWVKMRVKSHRTQ